MMSEPWKGYMPPFKVYGNTYFVGTAPASAHIIDTRAGLILLDSGYQETLYLILESIRKCGFNPANIKYIIHSHGHIDHAGATRAIVELTHAKTFIGEGDYDMVTGKNSLTYAQEFNMKFNTFIPDNLLHDGDQIELGNTVIECIATPGHTPGVISYFWNSCENGKSYRTGTMGGAGINTMTTEYIQKYHLENENWRKAFRRSIERCRQEKVEIFIGNHVQDNVTERYQALCSGNTEAFIDPAEWNQFLDRCQCRINELEATDPLSV